MSRLWDKGGSVDDLVLRYTVGDDHLLDARLVPHDVRASKAHARMLAAVGLLSSGDAEALERALDALAEEHAAGQWTISREEEDVHTALENRLVERLGDAGKRLHLGRSRNDQVLTALRLYLRETLEGLAGRAGAVADALASLAAREAETPLPGYTHQQRAMPSSVALWAEGHRAQILDDLEGLAGSSRRIARCPLGSAAGYGTPGLPLDRAMTARELGFDGPEEPVTACQLGRGKAEATLLFELSLLMQDLGRLAADLCLFATQEFAFVRLPSAFTTGSSIMPQKRNPDVFELVRARAAQAPADLQAVLAVTTKMTSGYHRDLQLVKPPLFRGLDNARETLEVMAHALPEVRFDARRTVEAMDPSLHATEEAWRLVTERGMTFRDAYREVGKKYGEAPFESE